MMIKYNILHRKTQSAAAQDDSASLEVNDCCRCLNSSAENFNTVRSTALWDSQPSEKSFPANFIHYGVIGGGEL
jgi:hypothetical protein